MLYDTTAFLFLERDLFFRMRKGLNKQHASLSASDHSRILECFAMHKKGRLQTKTVIQRVRKWLAQAPDLWVRFYRMVEPNAKRTIPVVTRQGPFGSLTAELIQHHVLPLLSYPCAGRLASVCKWARECVDLECLVDKRVRFENMLPGRLEALNSSLRIWTIEDEPVTMNVVTQDLKILGIVYAGRNYLCRDMSIFDRLETKHAVHDVDFSFTDLLGRLLRAADVSAFRIWAKCSSITHHTLHLEIGVYGDVSPVRSKHQGGDAVFKFSLELYPSTNWGPV